MAKAAGISPLLRAAHLEGARLPHIACCAFKLLQRPSSSRSSGTSSASTSIRRLTLSSSASTEVPDPGPRSHATRSSDEERPATMTHDTSARHHHPLRRARRARRQAFSVAACSAIGIKSRSLPQYDRAKCRSASSSTSSSTTTLRIGTPRSAPGSPDTHASPSTSHRPRLVANASRFFAKLTARLKRGVSSSSTQTPQRFITDQHSTKPFVWTKHPDTILAAVKRGRQTLEPITLVLPLVAINTSAPNRRATSTAQGPLWLVGSTDHVFLQGHGGLSFLKMPLPPPLPRGWMRSDEGTALTAGWWRALRIAHEFSEVVRTA